MRRQDWPRRLAETIEAASERPFAYGSFDCCQFVADVVEAMTDSRPGFGGYKTVAGAVRKVKRAGGLKVLVAELAQRAGYREVPTAFAQRGDVMLIDEPADGFDGMVGIRVEAGIAVAGPSGVAILPWQRAARAWRVG